MKTITYNPETHVLVPRESTEQQAKEMEVQRVWLEGRGWVCVYCRAPTNTFHIATGHDHTDDEIFWCECTRSY